MSRSRNRSRGRRPQQNNRAHFQPNPDYAAAKAGAPAGLTGNATGKPIARPFAEVLNQYTGQQTWGPTRPMARDSMDAVPFGPINPHVPQPISPTRTDTGRPEVRIWEYPVGWNIPGNETRLIPWDVLYTAAAQVDIMRRCIEIRKRHVRSLDWAFGVSTEAIAAAYRADPRRGKDDLESQLREKYQPEIDRLTEFWTKPWRTNGMSFGQWVNAVQDQHLTLDAVAIYPRTTYGGDVIDLEIVDASTIKPLADWRGARPSGDHPAFQQVLYGFPRGEYTATCEVDDQGNTVMRGGYKADQLYYWRETFRPRSFYGLSAVEQALLAARLYMKRQGWMLSEYDDGSTPLTWLVPEGAEASELDPRQRREYETAINDDLGGQTAARHRIKLSYPGFKPEMMPSVDERYKPDYDLHLIKLLASFFGVPITELGFTETKGLGSTGYHEGQEDVMDRVGRRPDIACLRELINDISRTWLGAPPEIEFDFLGLESEDEAAQDAVADTRVRSGRMTYNEDRKRLGLPLYDFPEADMPIVVSQRGGVTFLEGAAQVAQPGVMLSPAQAAPTDTPPGGTQAAQDGQQGAAGSAATGEATQGANGAPRDAGAQQRGGKPAAEAAKAADPTAAVTDSDSTRQRVHDQLARDYPEDSMAWLAQAVWSGPETVPTADIDFSNEEDWRATDEPDKVERFTGKIRQGKLKPIILVNTPDARKYIVIDGHHRALAYRQLGVPAVAYIGRVATKTGPWDTMHASQRSGASAKAAEPIKARLSAGEYVLNPATVSVVLEGAALDSAVRTQTRRYTQPSDAVLDKAVRAEVAAYRNWQRHARKRGNRGEFVFTHPEAERIAKAGDASDPKAPTARTWPGWERDQTLAAHYAQRLRTAVTARVDTAVLADRWGAARGLTKAGRSGAEDDARAWLHDNLTAEAIRAALGAVLADAYAEGWLLGDRSAVAVVNSVRVDWSGWEPGDPDAARLLLGDTGTGSGLAQLLDVSGVTIASITSNRLDELARALADAVGAGQSVDDLARVLRGILDDPQWAELVAVTEINRAISAATLDTYGQMGVEAKTWMTAADDRVCPLVCEANSIDGPIPLGALFTSGVAAPPGHPRCRCALDAATVTPAEAEGA